MRSRRTFLKQASMGVGVGLPLWALSRRVKAQGHGELVPDPDGIFDLPEGFSYQIVQRRGDPMSDGFRTPGKMDGMICFENGDGDYVLLRNQELSPAHAEEDRAYGADSTLPLPRCTYDREHYGGVVRLVLDAQTLEIKDSRLVLHGTFMNCAGGKSPWGWLSCEEIDDVLEADPEVRHGYVFLVRPSDDGTNRARPIPGYGRFRHEAAVVAPTTRTCYLTEDRGDGCFYRFVPNARRTPRDGVLQALKVTGSDGFVTGMGLAQGQVLDVEWVDVEDPVARERTTRAQAQAKGAAIFTRGEGIAEHDGDVYVCATTGGPQALGQIFRYRDLPGSAPFDPTVRGTLELTLQNEDQSLLAQPDNLFVAPWGDLILCEDAYNGVQHLRALTPDGEIYDLGRNALSSLELAGVCTSPDGQTLFVNLQHDAIMLAIRGPFPETRQATPPTSLEGGGCNVSRTEPRARMLAGLSGAALSLAKLRRSRL